MGGKGTKAKVVTLVSKKDGKITYSYQTMKNKNLKEKLRLRKYNPVTRQHEEFVETKSSKS